MTWSVTYLATQVVALITATTTSMNPHGDRIKKEVQCTSFLLFCSIFNGTEAQIDNEGFAILFFLKQTALLFSDHGA